MPSVDGVDGRGFFFLSHERNRQVWPRRSCQAAEGMVVTFAQRVGGMPAGSPAASTAASDVEFRIPKPNLFHILEQRSAEHEPPQTVRLYTFRSIKSQFRTYS